MKLFEVVDDLVLSNLTIGQLVATKGFAVAGDEGQGDYLIAGPQTVDELIDHTIANGNVALFQRSPAIRTSLLDNPLCHLFKVNKLVDTLHGALNWTRDSGATYVDRYGVVQYSPNRFGTNLALWSEDFTDAVWSMVDSSVTANANLAPDGNLTADKLVEGLGASTHSTTQNITVSNGAITTQSIRVKAAERKWILILEINSNSGYYIDVENGVIGGSLGSPLAVSVSPEGGGWYKVTLTAQIPATAARFRVYLATGDGGDVYTGDGVSGLYLWGAQFEENSKSGSYVRTLGTDITVPTLTDLPEDQSREEAAGWLIEGERENLQLFSNEVDIANAGWASFDGGTGDPAITTPNFAVAPDGSMTASRVQLDLNGGITNTDQSGIRGTWQTAVGVQVSYSVYLKANAGAQIIRCDFNGATPDTGLPTVNLTDEWVLHTWTLDSPTGSANSLRFRLRGAQTTSKEADFLVWGGQAEFAPFSSSLIPTLAVEETRAADLVSAGSVNNFVPAIYSVVFEFDIIGSVGAQQYAFSLDTGNITGVQGRNNNAEGLRATNNGDNTGAGTETVPNTLYSVGVNYDGAEIGVSIDGVFRNSSESLPASGESTLFLGSDSAAGAQLYGHLKSFKMYPVILTAAEMAYVAVR